MALGVEEASELRVRLSLPGTTPATRYREHWLVFGCITLMQ